MARLAGRLEFVYELEGNIHEVDVFQLAPALLALGRAIQEGHRTVNPDEPEIAVNVRPFAEGSFFVDIVLFHAPALLPLIAALGPDPVQRITEALKIIGYVRGTATSVMDVIRKLGRPPERIEEIAPGEVRFTAGANTVTSNGPVRDLLMNPVFVQNFYGSYRPVEQEQIRDVRSFLKDEPNTAVTVYKRDVPAIRAYAETRKPVAMPEG